MIALIAHDKKKPEMVNFVQTHLEFLWRTSCVATGTTGEFLNRDLTLNVRCVAPGAEGEEMIIDLVARGEVHAVIFFRDPLTPQPDDPDVSLLLRACDVHNVPVATNPATAEAILRMMEESQNRCK